MFEILGLTLEMTRFEKREKKKLVKANKCLLVIRKLRNEGYRRVRSSIHVISFVTASLYGISVIATSPLVRQEI